MISKELFEKIEKFKKHMKSCEVEKKLNETLEKSILFTFIG